MEEIAAGNAEEARRIAASRLAARQPWLDQFDDGVVSAAPARRRQAVKSPSYPRI
jgi:hypothetical protein